MVEKGCFSTSSEETLGTFLARLSNSVVLQGHGDFLPVAVSFSSRSRISVMDSEDTVGSNSRQQKLWKNGRKGMFFNDFRRDVRDFFGSDFLPVAVSVSSRSRISVEDSEDIVGSNSRQQKLWKNGRKRMFFYHYRRDVRHFLVFRFGSNWLKLHDLLY